MIQRKIDAVRALASVRVGDVLELDADLPLDDITLAGRWPCGNVCDGDRQVLWSMSERR